MTCEGPIARLTWSSSKGLSRGGGSLANLSVLHAELSCQASHPFEMDKWPLRRQFVSSSFLETLCTLLGGRLGHLSCFFLGREDASEAGAGRLDFYLKMDGGLM